MSELWLFELAPRLTRLENSVLKGISPPLTFRQYRLLRRVADGYTTLTAIATRGTLAISAISVSLDALARKGLLVRRVDDSDRRSAQLEITADGMRALVQGQERLDELARSLLHGLSDERRQQLRADVEKIGGRVSEMLRKER